MFVNNMDKVSRRFTSIFKLIKLTGCLLVNFDQSSCCFTPMPPIKLKLCALSLLLLNCNTQGTYLKEDKNIKQSGENLVRILSDMTYNCLVVTTAVFILKCTNKLADILNQISSLQVQLDVPFWSPACFAMLHIIMVTSNFINYFTKYGLISALMAMCCDACIVSISCLHMFIHHLLWECLNQLNGKIKADLNSDEINQLRQLFARFYNACEDVQAIFGFVTLIMIADHSFYVQTDVFYFVATTYDWAIVGIEIKQQVLTNFLLHTLWAVIDFIMVLLGVIICARVEQEV